MSRRDHYLLQYGTPVDREDDAFPEFKDGDVKIILSGSHQYKLHSTFLKTYSRNGTIAELLDDAYAAQLSKQAIKRGVVVRYRLIGVSNDQEDGEPKVLLEPVALNDEGKPSHGNPIGLDLENGLITPPVYRAYHAVLGAVYSRPIELGDFDDSNLSDMIVTASEIIVVAEYLGMINAITKPIEADLQAKGQLLHRAISSDPAPWLAFAFRIKSKVIFREALIHAVGQANTDNMKQAMMYDLNPKIVAVLNKKIGILEAGVGKATLLMLSYYPPQLQRELTVGYADADNIGRNSYSNDVFNWVGLSIFRHYIGQNCASDSIKHAEDMGYDFMEKISIGGDSYLSKADLEEFHRRFPMTSKGVSVVERWVSKLKVYCKKWATHFFENRSQLDVKTYPSGYFTNTKVDVDDYVFLK